MSMELVIAYVIITIAIFIFGYFDQMILSRKGFGMAVLWPLVLAITIVGWIIIGMKNVLVGFREFLVEFFNGFWERLLK